MIRIAGFILLLVVPVGALVALNGVGRLYGELADEERIRSVSSAEPQTIALKDYLESGAGGNRHLRLTRFLVCKEYTRAPGAPRGKNYVYCVPVIPEEDKILAGSHEPQPPAVRLVVQFNDPIDIEDVRLKSELAGLIDDFDKLPKHDRDKMLAEYKQTDARTCQVLRAGARPLTDDELDRLDSDARTTIIVGSAVSGVALAALLTGWIIRRRGQRHHAHHPEAREEVSGASNGPSSPG